MYQVNVSSVDGELAFFLPPEVAAKMGVSEGSQLWLVESAVGYLVTPLEPLFADQIHAATEGIVRYRDALKELSE